MLGLAVGLLDGELVGVFVGLDVRFEVGLGVAFFVYHGIIIKGAHVKKRFNISNKHPKQLDKE